MTIGFQILTSLVQEFVKGEEFCFRYCDFYFSKKLQPAKGHGESTFTASQLSHKINKVPLYPCL